MQKQADIFHDLAARILKNKAPMPSPTHSVLGGALGGVAAYGLQGRKWLGTEGNTLKNAFTAEANFAFPKATQELAERLTGSTKAKDLLAGLSGTDAARRKALQSFVTMPEKERIALFEGSAHAAPAVAVLPISHHGAAHKLSADDALEATIQRQGNELFTTAPIWKANKAEVIGNIKSGIGAGVVGGGALGALRRARHEKKVNRLANVLQVAALGGAAGGAGYNIHKLRQAHNMQKQSSVSPERYARIHQLMLEKQAELSTAVAKRLTAGGLGRFVTGLSAGTQPLSGLAGDTAGGMFTGGGKPSLLKRVLMGRTQAAQGAVLGAKPLQATDRAAWRELVEEKSKAQFGASPATEGLAFPSRGSPEYTNYLKAKNPIVVQHNREMAHPANPFDAGAWGRRFKKPTNPELYAAPAAANAPAAGATAAPHVPAGATTLAEKEALEAAAKKSAAEKAAASGDGEPGMLDRASEFVKNLTGTDIAAAATPAGAFGMYAAGHKINPGIDWGRFAIPVGGAAAGGAVLGGLSSHNKQKG